MSAGHIDSCPYGSCHLRCLDAPHARVTTPSLKLGSSATLLFKLDTAHKHRIAPCEPQGITWVRPQRVVICMVPGTVVNRSPQEAKGDEGRRLDREGLEKLLHRLEQADLNSVREVSASQVCVGSSSNHHIRVLGYTLVPASSPAYPPYPHTMSRGGRE